MEVNLSAALFVDADLTDADLSGADLVGTDMTGTILQGALYDENTLFPSGDTYLYPPWGLDGDIEPWNAGMKPTPEPSTALSLLIGAAALAGLSMMKGGS